MKINIDDLIMLLDGANDNFAYFDSGITPLNKDSLLETIKAVKYVMELLENTASSLKFSLKLAERFTNSYTPRSEEEQ
jgi:hypothetical protein